MSNYLVTIHHYQSIDEPILKFEVSAESYEELCQSISDQLDKSFFLSLSRGEEEFFATRTRDIRRVNVERVSSSADAVDEMSWGEASDRVRAIFEAVSGKPFGGAA